MSSQRLEWYALATMAIQSVCELGPSSIFFAAGNLEQVDAQLLVDGQILGSDPWRAKILGGVVQLEQRAAVVAVVHVVSAGDTFPRMGNHIGVILADRTAQQAALVDHQREKAADRLADGLETAEVAINLGIEMNHGGAQVVEEFRLAGVIDRREHRNVQLESGKILAH